MNMMTTKLARALERVFFLLVLVGGVAATFGAPAGRLAELSAQVEALPAASLAEQGKHAVLTVALERAAVCISAGGQPEGEVLLDEVAAALSLPAECFTAHAPSATNISGFAALFVTNRNPYLEQIVGGVPQFLAGADRPWPKSTAAKCVFNDVYGKYGARDVAGEMEALWWVYANSASPLRGDGKVLTRLLRRYHAYVDAIVTAGEKTRTGAVFYDDFAIAPAAAVLREMAAAFPGLLLPGQKKDLDRAMRLTGDKFYASAKDRRGDYANIDVAIACTLLNCGLYLGESALLDKARFLIYAQEKNLLGDGGFHYIWSQNESAGYHAAVTSYLTRYLEITGDAWVAEILRCTQWHGPVVGRLVEFWTCPSWKGTWNQNSGGSSGGESVVALSGNPFLRGLVNPAAGKGEWISATRRVRWFRNDIAGRTLPDNFTARDRDIAGVRAWYGAFNYAATLRPIATNEPGLATIMGAQLMTANHRLQQAFMGVQPRVRISPNGYDGQKINPRAWAWLTSGLEGGSVVGRDCSAVAGRYQLHAFASSTKGPLADWNGTQVWLGLPDRIIGLVSLRPRADGAKAYEVNGALQFCFGGTALGTAAKLVAEAPNRYRYGGFEVIVHDSNFARTETVAREFRRANAPISEIVFRDAAGLTNVANKPLAYPQTRENTFVVEIRAQSSASAAKVSRRTLAGGIIALDIAVAAKSWRVLFNPSASAADCVFPPDDAPARSSLHLAGSEDVPLRVIPASVTLAPAQLALVVVSPDDRDHLPGWSSFAEMVGAPADGYQPSAKLK